MALFLRDVGYQHGGVQTLRTSELFHRDKQKQVC